MKLNNTTARNGNWTGLILLGVFITLIYSNTFRAAWHFDDYPNIVQNPTLHIDSLSPSALSSTFFTNAYMDLKMKGRLYRPVANLTLALNWYFGGENVIGYHIVNLVVHVLNTFLLFLTIKALLTTSLLREKYRYQAHVIALLTATLWAANPIQTQAITYVVQRMASLAAFFYLTGLFCYVQGRRAQSRAQQRVWFVGCLVSYFCAVGSKENTILMPLALGLIEIVFYQDIDRLKANKRFIVTALVSGLIIFILGVVLFIILKGDPIDYFQRRYADRPFTLGQRLLTEPRVLVLYLSQLFYPGPDRLSIVHDIAISTSLVNPWTTLPAIGMVAGLIGIGIKQVKSRPFLAFGILFYFLNHLVESTVFPLEIAYEHRNYLPSLFVFLAPAAGLIALIERYGNRSKIMALALSVGITLLIVMLGIGTYTRNMVWQTQKSLWQDVALKQPGLARPLQKMAEIYNHAGQNERALKLYTQALALRDPKPKQSRILSYNNIGNIYFTRGSFQNAIESFERVLEIDPDYERARFNLALVLVAANQLEQALTQAEILLSREDDHPKFLNLKGHILIKLNRPEEALSLFRKAFRLAPENRNTLLNLGVGFMVLGDHPKSDWFLRLAAQLYPNDTLILLRLIENALLADKQTDADRYLARLFNQKRVPVIVASLKQLPDETRILPINHGMLKQAVQAYIEKDVFIKGQ